jgi:hypothetical protein
MKAYPPLELFLTEAIFDLIAERYANDFADYRQAFGIDLIERYRRRLQAQ